MTVLWFGTKRSGETLKLSFDFAADLATGETLSTPVVAASVYGGSDPPPSGILSGSPAVSGSLVTQLVTGGLDHVTYQLVFQATTSNSQILQGVSLLPVSNKVE